MRGYTPFSDIFHGWMHITEVSAAIYMFEPLCMWGPVHVGPFRFVGVLGLEGTLIFRGFYAVCRNFFTDGRM